MTVRDLGRVVLRNFIAVTTVTASGVMNFLWKTMRCGGSLLVPTSAAFTGSHKMLSLILAFLVLLFDDCDDIVDGRCRRDDWFVCDC